jgi:hypothetical protein
MTDARRPNEARARRQRQGGRTIADRVGAVDWTGVSTDLDEVGVADAGPVLTAGECRSLAAMYADDERFRSTVDMARHRYGRGRYRYFEQPLPDAVTELRAALWPHLLALAREWAARRNRAAPWPDAFDDWLAVCHAGGQRRPTPLLFEYREGDWNALHQDLYGELVFPLQVVIGLDRPELDYTGGEFVVVGQRPRAQSRATAVRLERGHAVVFATREHPVRTMRGWSNGPTRHGVSVVRSGRRRTLGLIFHDAE